MNKDSSSTLPAFPDDQAGVLSIMLDAAAWSGLPSHQRCCARQLAQWAKIPQARALAIILQEIQKRRCFWERTA